MMCAQSSSGKAGRVAFYKVPFSAVPDLVARRQVLLRGGYAYVGEAQVRVGNVGGCVRLRVWVGACCCQGQGSGSLQHCSLAWL
jgi:hypothetical protein